MSRNSLNAAKPAEAVELKETIVSIKRVSKVVKGGRRFGFSAVVIVGDKKGKVGWGLGKAQKEVMEARGKAAQAAKRAMIHVKLKEGRTIYHDIKGHFGAGYVVLRSAPPGTGIIAGGAMRAIFESLGIQDIVAKSVGSTNVHNIVKATFDALRRLESPNSVASKRNLKVTELLHRQSLQQSE